MSKFDHSYVIRIEGHITPTANDFIRRNRWTHQRNKQQWLTYIKYAINQPRIDIPKAVEGEHRAVTVYRFACLRADYANLWTPIDKFIIDNMRAKIRRKISNKMRVIDGPLGFIWDDDDKHLTLDVVPIKVKTMAEQCMKIVVEVNR